MHPEEATSSTRNLANEFSSALLQATSKTGNVLQSDSQTATDANHTQQSNHQRHSFPRMSESYEPQKDYLTRNSNLIQSNVSQFTSSFMEDKRHLGTRDTHVPFQPAILLSPPRQRDRSTVVRPKVASVGAYPMSASDGTVVGTIHSMQRVAHPMAQSVSSYLYHTAVPMSRPSHQQSSLSTRSDPANLASHPGHTDSDLTVRIAQLTKQHEEAQNRLVQLKSGGRGHIDRPTEGRGVGPVEQGSLSRNSTDLSSTQPVSSYPNRLSNGE